MQSAEYHTPGRPGIRAREPPRASLASTVDAPSPASWNNEPVGSLQLLVTEAESGSDRLASLSTSFGAITAESGSAIFCSPLASSLSSRGTALAVCSLR